MERTQRNQTVEPVSVIDLFDDIKSEPLRVGEEVRNPILGDLGAHGNTSTFSFNCATLSGASATAAGDHP